MPTIRAFTGYLVNPAHAATVVSPAYDAVSAQQRCEFAEAHPQNFLNTMRLLEDFPPAAQPSIAELLATNKAKLEQLLRNGCFDTIDTPGLFIYQLTRGQHQQTGLVCEIGVSQYEQAKLRKHENTRRDKEELLTQYQQVVGVTSSPICLAYTQRPKIQRYLQQAVQAAPQLDFVAEDGVRQRVWGIHSPEEQAHLVELFAAVDITYLTDGHHRAAAAQRYAKMMRQKHGNQADAPFNQLLVALFADEQLNLLPFHRCVKDLNQLSEAELLRALQAQFDVHRLPADTPGYTPEQHGQFGLLVNHHWYRLTLKAGLVDPTDPVAALDVSILQNYILEPLLGIQDSRSDARLDYVAGVCGHEGLQQKCTEGWQLGFTCHPTSIEQLMRVADAGQLMPPKSTYFDPKARSGIFVRRK